MTPLGFVERTRAVEVAASRLNREYYRVHVYWVLGSSVDRTKQSNDSDPAVFGHER
jgi:hypothetical protein